MNQLVFNWHTVQGTSQDLLFILQKTHGLLLEFFGLMSGTRTDAKDS